VELLYTSPLFQQALDATDLEEGRKQEIRQHVATYGSCQEIADLPETMRHAFVVSSDISAEEHVRMQAAIQAFVDNSISKTINFPEGASEDDVAQAYLLAWELGCKGLTVYVTGSRQEVVLETKATRAKKDGDTADVAPAASSALVQSNGYVAANGVNGDESAHGVQDVRPAMIKRPRPHRLTGSTYRKDTPLGSAYITVNSDEYAQPFEVFLNVGKAGSDVSAVSEAIGRLISLVLRMPGTLPPAERLRWVMDEMAGIGGGRPMGFGANRVRSLPDGIAQVLADYLSEHPTVESNEVPAEQLALPIGQRAIGDICPECGEASFLNVEGCRKCHVCGYSEC
jgi:ribonucleoside-diphosphate reductase alpha chain